MGISRGRATPASARGLLLALRSGSPLALLGWAACKASALTAVLFNPLTFSLPPGRAGPEAQEGPFSAQGPPRLAQAVL